MTSGQRIKEHRLNLGETMEEFGRRFNAHKSIVSKWEKDLTKPNVKRLRIIADDMNITVSELLGVRKMSKRKNVSNKTRFEVFKRDNFTCQYCGKSAPEVVLNVDHIEPVSKGGSNDISNLITSCFECNNGKGNKN